MKNLRTLLLIGSLVIPFSTYSQPSITLAEGNPNIGSTITIIGNGFDTNRNIPLIFDEIVNLDVYSNINVGSTVPTSTGLWTANSTGEWDSPITFNEIDGYSNTPTRTYRGVGRSHVGWPKPVTDAAVRSLYVSWMVNPSENFDKDGGPNKVIRIWDDPSGNNTRISWNAVALGYANDGNWAPLSWSNWGGSSNQWNRLEIYADADKSIIKAWTNGKLIHDVSDFKKSSTTSRGLNIGLIGFDPRTGDNFKDLKFDFVDIYVSDSLARIELSNMATWDLAQVDREVQPTIEWSSNRIVFQVSDTRLDIDKPMYVYVVDKDGNVNNTGFEISPCSNCPLPPILDIN